MAGIDEVQLRAEDDYAFEGEGDIADDSKFCSLPTEVSQFLYLVVVIVAVLFC